MAAMRSKNSADTDVPTMPPTSWNCGNLVLRKSVAQCHDGAHHDHDGRMTERKKEADADGPLSGLHQLASCVVDCGDVIGVNGVAKAEPISHQTEAQGCLQVGERVNASAHAPMFRAASPR